jgi:hypothetical protein
MAVLALLPDFSILMAWWQLEQVAYDDFRGSQPFHREVLDLERFELGIFDDEPANRQAADGQCSDGKCAHCDRADCASVMATPRKPRDSELRS